MKGLKAMFISNLHEYGILCLLHVFGVFSLADRNLHYPLMGMMWIAVISTALRL